MLGYSIHNYPIPDSAKWFGDESWLMLEARTQITEGVLRHPYALGATINHYVGMLGLTWTSSLIYGLPAAIFAHRFPIILIGRTVTFVIGLVSIVVLLQLIFRTTKRLWFSALIVALLIATAAFALASHRARPDLLLGLVVLSVVGYFAKRADTKYESSREWFFFGIVMTLLGLTIFIHLVTLLAPLSLYIMVQKGAFRNLKLVLAAFGGVAIAAGSLVLIYYLTTGDLSLFGAHGQYVQSEYVASQKPTIRLFSRSVQWNNLVERMQLLWHTTPVLLVLFVITLARLLWDLARRKADYFRNPEVRFITIATVIVFFSWLLFQTSIEYYVPHFLLLAFYAVAILFNSAFSASLSSIPSGVLIRIIGILTVLLLSATQISALQAANTIGNKLLVENQKAETDLFKAISEDAKLRGNSKPLVLAETPCALYLETETTFGIMYPFLSQFADRSERLDTTFNRFGVRYAILFGHAGYKPLFTSAEWPRYKILKQVSGTFYDIEQDYIHLDTNSDDTMTLYRIGEVTPR
jgi:MFS family permease